MKDEALKKVKTHTHQMMKEQMKNGPSTMVFEDLALAGK